MSTQAVAPRPNVMIGLTHSAEGLPVIREAKVLKVGIGHARGKACDVFVNSDGKWVVRSATEGPDKKLKFEVVGTFALRSEAEAAFRIAWRKAPMCGYPRKTAYFNFTRPVMAEDGGEMYVPDFEAIEAHSFVDPNKPGMPTEIDIFFLDNDPFQGEYQNWSAAELKCHGDGVNALRSISMAQTPEEQALARTAKANGQKYFPVTNGCWTCNCPYTKEIAGANGRTQPAPCKPSGTLRFQMVRNPRIGGTAFFHSGSFKTIPQIFSALERIKGLTNGRLACIPLKMVVRSHKTNHNGQAAVQQNVSIEFRAEDMEHLRTMVLEQAWKFENLGMAAPRTLDAAPEEVLSDDRAPEAGEFFVDGEEGEATDVSPAAAATQSATASLGDKLTAVRKSEPEPVANLPWIDRNSMNTIYRAQRDRIGEARCNEIVSANGVMLASLRPEDPKAMAVYADMLASPDAPKKPAREVPF